MTSFARSASAWLASVNRAVPIAIAWVLNSYAVIVVLSWAHEFRILGSVPAGLVLFPVIAFGWLPAIILHEIGHAAAAWLCGWRVWLFCAGPFVIRFGRRVAFEARGRLAADAGGFVLPSPRSPETATRLRAAAISAAGPIVSVAAAAIAFWMPLTSSIGPLGGPLLAFGASSLATAVLTSWPYRTKTGRGNDLMQVAELLSHPSRDPKLSYFGGILALIDHGFGPHYWDHSLLREVNTELEGNAAPSSWAVAVAFLEAIHRSDFERACAVADLPLPTQKGEGTQHYLRAWADACERGDFGAADHALAQGHGTGISAEWIMQVREMALIGVLANDGQLDWANRKLECLKAEIKSGSVLRDVLQRLLDRALAGPLGLVFARQAASSRLYHEAEDDADRRETLADWDDLPADEALDEPS